MRTMIGLAAWLLMGQVLLAAEAKAPPAGPKEDEKGFASLFNGKDLDGWQGATDGYAAENGVLVCKKTGAGNLLTKKEYGDFIFRFEFKLEPDGNNGVALRTPLEGNPAYVGMECQILDDSAACYKDLKDWQFHGSIYGLIPAKRGHLKPVGQWNQEEIVLKGSKVKVTLNGTVIVDGDLKSVGQTTPDGQEHPGRFRAKGHLGFMSHGHPMQFRNLRIKEL